MTRALLVNLLVLTILLPAGCSSSEVPAGAASATFVVHCYDVGAAALEGRPGVLEVERGWHGLREVDRVLYDPRRVDVSQMEQWLKEADTYVSTIGDAIPFKEKEKER